MDLGRLRKGEWLAAAASVALLVVSFLPWFGWQDLPADAGAAPAIAVIGDSATAWQAFAVWDVVLAAFAAMGLALAALPATRRSPAGPIAAAVLTTAVGIVLSVLLLLRVVFPPGPNELIEPRYGAWLGLLCTVGIAAGAWIAMADERTDAAEPAFVPAQPVPPEVAPAGSVVADGRVPSADDDRD